MNLYKSDCLRPEDSEGVGAGEDVRTVWRRSVALQDKAHSQEWLCH